MSYSICADIGGTKIYTGIVKNNRVFKSRKIKTKKNSGIGPFLAELKKALSFYQPEKAKNICLSFAGPIGQEGQTMHATNFPVCFSGYNFKKEIRRWAKKPVFIEHDGLCFTLAESILGAGKSRQFVLALTLGSGIGGGFSLNKKVYKGNLNLSEIGHFKITSNGYRCSCGRYGHFEAQASGPALAKYYQKITGRKLPGEEIHRLALKKDLNALRAAREMAYFLGLGLASLTNLLSPEIIVLGGGVSHFDAIIQLSKKTFSREVVDHRHKKIKIVKSKLGDDALLLGAALVSKGHYLAQ